MREVSTAEVLDCLESHRVAGFHIDSRLVYEVGQPGKMFMISLPNVEEFLSLVWQSVNDTRPLAPAGLPRTLRDCASRLSGFGWSFQTLVAAGYRWFERCVSIDDRFDYSKLGCIALTPLNETESRETPAGRYYIYDGVHKSIVLAKKLLRSQLAYRPLEALLLTPRRS